MKTKTLAKKVNGSENLPIVLWLVKDALWVMTMQTAAMVMVLPALFVAIHSAWKTRKNSTASFRNVAISYWIAANGMWMTGQYYNTTALVPYAMILFAAGVIVAVSYYAFILPAITKKSEVTQMGVSRKMMEEMKKVA